MISSAASTIGILAMLFGIGLMIWHWSNWTAASKSARSSPELRYAQNQFRRRAVIGSMMALTGSILVSLSWVADPRAFTASILVLFLLLVCILILAILDLVNVIVHFRLGPASHAARTQLINEYHRAQAGTTCGQPGFPLVKAELTGFCEVARWIPAADFSPPLIVADPSKGALLAKQVDDLFIRPIVIVPATLDGHVLAGKVREPCTIRERHRRPHEIIHAENI
jgi:hypothetical protein